MQILLSKNIQKTKEFFNYFLTRNYRVSFLTFFIYFHKLAFLKYFREETASYQQGLRGAQRAN